MNLKKLEKNTTLILLTLVVSVLLSGAAFAADQNSATTTASSGTVSGTAQNADLSITESTYYNETKYNEENYYYVTVKNLGPNTATGVTVSNVLPTNTKVLEWSVSWDGGLTRNDSDASFDPNSKVWNIGSTHNMTKKSSFWLDMVVVMNGTGTITNTANVTGDQTDPNPNNNVATTNVTVPPAADIAVTQSVNNNKPNFGDVLTITVTATNKGPDTANGVKITDLLPAGLKFACYSTSSTLYSIKGTYNSTSGIWDIGSLSNGEVATLKIIANVTATVNNTNIILNATKTNETEYDWNTTNDKNSTTLTTDLGSSVSTTATDDGHSTTGYQLPFSVNLLGTTYTTGTGSSAYKLWIHDNGFVYFSTDGVIDVTDYYIRKNRRNSAYPIYIPRVPTYNDGTYGTVYNKIAMIAPFWDDLDFGAGYGTIYFKNNGDSVTISWVGVPSYHAVSSGTVTKFDTFQVRITNDGKIGFIYGDMQWDNDWYNQYSYTLGRTVYAQAFAGMNKGDASTYSQVWTGASALSQITNQSYWFNSSSGTAVSSQIVDPDIAVTQNVSNNTPVKGDTMTMTITVVNNGPDDATGVQITDNIPQGLTLLTAAASDGTYDSQTGVWNIGDLNINETATLTLTVKVNADSGTIINRAEKTAEDQYDPITENDVSEISINPQAPVYDGLSVVDVNPADGSIDVNQNQQIVITFNEDIQAGTNYNGITVRNAATGQGYSITKTIVGNQLIITGKWTPGTTFEIVIPKNAVKNLNGIQNKNSFTSTFTSSLGASVVSVDPEDGATNVASNQQITITFDDAIQAGANYNAITVRNAETGQGYSITKTIVGNQLIITGKWTPGTTFEIVIPKNAVKDSEDNANANIYTSTFTAGNSVDNGTGK